jgi:hypothetical protein
MMTINFLIVIAVLALMIAVMWRNKYDYLAILVFCIELWVIIGFLAYLILR